MLIKIYDERYLAALKARKKKALLIGIIALALSYGGAAAICFFLNDAWFRFEVIMMILLSTLGGFVFLYYLFSSIIPVSKKLKFIKGIDDFHYHRVEGKLLHISETLTIADSVEAREITVETEGKEMVLYLPTDVPFELQEGQDVILYHEFYKVVAYEE